jgi:hypothetical protein
MKYVLYCTRNGRPRCWCWCWSAGNGKCSCTVLSMLTVLALLTTSTHSFFLTTIIPPRVVLPGKSYHYNHLQRSSFALRWLSSFHRRTPAVAPVYSTVLYSIHATAFLIPRLCSVHGRAKHLQCQEQIPKAAVNNSLLVLNAFYMKSFFFAPYFYRLFRPV